MIRQDRMQLEPVQKRVANGTEGDGHILVWPPDLPVIEGYL